MRGRSMEGGRVHLAPWAMASVLVWLGFASEARGDGATAAGSAQVWRTSKVWRAEKVWRATRAVPAQRLPQTLGQLDKLIDSAQAPGKPLPPEAASKSFHRQAAFTLPINLGPAQLNAGFNADGSLTFSVLAPPTTGGPSGRTGKAAATPLKQNVPFSAAVAQALLPGTQVLIEGRGQVAFHGDASPGKQLPVPRDLAKVNASGGGSASLSRESGLALLVKRLDGDKVLVSLSRADSGRAAASATGHLDAKVSVVDLVAKARISPLQADVTDQAQKLVDDVTKWTQLDVAARFERARSAKELRSWVLDLSKTEGAKAFNDLVRLDTKRADTLGAQGAGSGVTFTRMSRQAKEQGFSVQADVGKQISLLNWARNKSESSVVLKSSEGDISFNRVRFGESYSDLVTDLFRGKRSQSTQLVQMQRPGRPAEAYLHVRQAVQGDQMTSEADLHRFLAFADLIGAGSEKTAELHKNATTYREHFDNNFGRSSRTIDLYVKDAGLAKLAQASPEKIRSAFGQAYETLDRPSQGNIYLGDLDDVWGRTPWLVTEDPNHATIMRLLDTAGSPSRQADVQYRRITGRSLGVDSAAWQKSQRLIAFAARLREARTPAERAQEFAKISGSLDLGKTLATIGMVAGKENLLINELSLRGEKGFDLTVVRHR